SVGDCGVVVWYGSKKLRGRSGLGGGEGLSRACMTLSASADDGSKQTSFITITNISYRLQQTVLYAISGLWSCRIRRQLFILVWHNDKLRDNINVSIVAYWL